MTDSLSNPKAKRAEAAVWEGRSRIVWGENPSEILEYMIGEGVDEQHARDLIGIALKERSQHIRARGVVESIKGGAIFALGGAGVALIMIARQGEGKAFGAALIVMMLGFIRLCRGLGWMFSGSKMRGSVTDMDDQLL